MTDWTTKAKAEGRICPECKQPVSLKTWEDMNRKAGVTRSCWNCRYAHWEIPLSWSRGNVNYDNAERDAFTYIRQCGEPAKGRKRLQS